MEVFTFVRTTGSAERITVLPLGDATAIEARFSQFDAKEARCFLENDRQHLLGVIEAGFGSYSAFNTIVQEVFVKRLHACLSTDSTKGNWLSERSETDAVSERSKSKE